MSSRTNMRMHIDHSRTSAQVRGALTVRRVGKKNFLESKKLNKYGS